MRILILNGSPKRENSITLAMSKAFVEGMGAEAELIHVIDRNIEYCQGCLTCMRNGGTCVIRDDMDVILPKILTADIVIFSFPLYCYSMPAPMKTLVDRLLSIHPNEIYPVGNHYEHGYQKDISNISFVMISSCGFPEVSENYDAVVMQFKWLFRLKNVVVAVPEGPLIELPRFAKFRDEVFCACIKLVLNINKPAVYQKKQYFILANRLFHLKSTVSGLIMSNT